MPHIHTEPGQHDHTVSMYIVRTDGLEPRMMLHLHKKFNIYLQFGGHIELDENPMRAMTHELREETGYDMSQMQILQPRGSLRKLHGATIHPVAAVHNTHFIPDDHYHTDLGYAFTTDQEPKHHPDEGESREVIFCTRDELAALPADKVIENSREIALYVFDHILENWEPISPLEFAL
ncbi:MAG: pyrophosphohydrolase including oxidative damage repair enzyme [Candidatus Saccharibacteria bacterium]|nr:pyrophosphohydrolase including oxidative damage repair enzyme [Candidatus Saccharibacteria bacterium]